jgi:tetratricopeptide (TPR) repeat protein
VEAYKTALWAYVLSSPPQQKKATATMKLLEEAVKSAGGTTAQLTQIYIGLGSALEKQAAELRKAGRPKDAARINAAFAQFLDRIAHEPHANWPTRVWLAQTYYNLGNADRAATADAPQAAAAPLPLSAASKAYLAKARDGYQQLIDDAAKDPKLPPNPTSVLAARLQLGECLKALGEYEKALDMFAAVLTERGSLLSVQRSAAQTYEERGQVEDAKWLEKAIYGGYPAKTGGENRVWGWLKIAEVTARAARTDNAYRDPFFEARFQIARCRYLIAMKAEGDARRSDLNKAKQSILSIVQIYRDVGGEHWRGEFDSLLKQVQVALGEKPTGLGEPKAATSAASTEPTTKE